MNPATLPPGAIKIDFTSAEVENLKRGSKYIVDLLASNDAKLIENFDQIEFREVLTNSLMLATLIRKYDELAKAPDREPLSEILLRYCETADHDEETRCLELVFWRVKWLSVKIIELFSGSSKELEAKALKVSAVATQLEVADRLKCSKIVAMVLMKVYFSNGV